MPQMHWLRRPGRLAVAFSCACAVIAPGLGAAQSRRATTLDALDQHPFFFHGQEIILVSEATAEQVLTWLVNDDDSVRLLALDVPPPPEGIRERLEIIGTFYDVGRLDEGDQRLAGLPIRRLSEELLRRPWPAIGELPLVVATSSRPAATTAATTLRTIVLDPDRYLDDGVTVIGRFRGRNLYGDLPEAPDASRWDFVLHSADAAAWVVGREPKGDGFELPARRNCCAGRGPRSASCRWSSPPRTAATTLRTIVLVDSRTEPVRRPAEPRVDTGRWLEVTGAVRVQDGMVLVDAGTLALADPVADRPPPAAVETRRLPPPEVIFSAPLPDDVNVSQDTTVRVQFSRDMDPDSFDGQIRVAYTRPGGTEVDTDAEEILFELAYRGRNRVLEIRFDQELERFRSIAVELSDGVTANDGTPLPPWTLSFFIGG